MRYSPLSKMPNAYAPTRRASKVGDWIEATALIRATSVGGHALEELGQEVGYSPADVAMGLRTMARRATVLGSTYPFRVAAGGAAATVDAAEAPWTAMLLMSPESPVRNSINLQEAAAHLERVTAAALKSLYGPGTSTLRFGWPSEDGRPAAFSDAIHWLAGIMQVSVGAAYRPPYTKDGGVDVVAWRPFPDGRSGFPVLLTQCTLEKDYKHKASDVDVRVWSGWLALDVAPATALAIPDVVAGGEEWNTLASRTIILDRIRLSSLLTEPLHCRPLLRPVMGWTRQQIAAMREYL
jgi:hypothetical protein